MARFGLDRLEVHSKAQKMGATSSHGTIISPEFRTKAEVIDFWSQYFDMSSFKEE